MFVFKDRLKYTTFLGDCNTNKVSVVFNVSPFDTEDLYMLQFCLIK